MMKNILYLYVFRMKFIKNNSTMNKDLFILNSEIFLRGKWGREEENLKKKDHKQ